MAAGLVEFEITKSRFVDKSTILYGETATGKSVVIVDILHCLNSYVDQILVISPTDRQNHTYDSIVPLPYIHYTMNMELLTELWERQNALASVYTRANNRSVLRELFYKIPGQEDVKEEIREMTRKYEECCRELRSAGDSDKIAKLGLAYQELLDETYKNYIKKFSLQLERLGNLDEDEEWALKYVGINPRIVVVFDDCTDLINKNKKHPIMQKIFFQGRWVFITILIACHTDKALDPELKKNAFVSVFTGEESANAFFNRKSNDLSADAVQKAKRAKEQTFTPMMPYQKLVWVRDEKSFYKFTAVRRDNFKFGSDAIKKYADEIRADGGGTLVDNKYMGGFN